MGPVPPRGEGPPAPRSSLYSHYDREAGALRAKEGEEMTVERDMIAVNLSYE